MKSLFSFILCFGVFASVFSSLPLHANESEEAKLVSFFEELEFYQVDFGNCAAVLVDTHIGEDFNILNLSATAITPPIPEMRQIQLVLHLDPEREDTARINSGLQVTRVKEIKVHSEKANFTLSSDPLLPWKRTRYVDYTIEKNEDGGLTHFQATSYYFAWHGSKVITGEGTCTKQQ